MPVLPIKLVGKLVGVELPAKIADICAPRLCPRRAKRGQSKTSTTAWDMELRLDGGGGVGRWGSLRLRLTHKQGKHTMYTPRPTWVYISIQIHVPIAILFQTHTGQATGDKRQATSDKRTLPRPHLDRCSSAMHVTIPAIPVHTCPTVRNKINEVVHWFLSMPRSPMSYLPYRIQSKTWGSGCALDCGSHYSAC